MRRALAKRNPRVGKTSTVRAAARVLQEQEGSCNGASLSASERFPMSLGRVLVVDDEPQVCTMIRELLDELGYDVQIAEGSAEAISLAITVGGDGLSRHQESRDDPLRTATRYDDSAWPP
jgi:PleD family two-component response regulator